MAHFDDYVHAHRPALVRLACVLSGDRGVAEEVVQEALLRAFGRWRAISSTGEAHPYVRRMVVNEYLSWRRKWGRVVPRADAGAAETQPDHAIRSADHDELARRLDRLPPRQRAALVLRYYEGLSDQDIGRVLGCGAGTVRTHVSRALATLRVDAARESSELTLVPLPQGGV